MGSIIYGLTEISLRFYILAIPLSPPAPVRMLLACAPPELALAAGAVRTDAQVRAENEDAPILGSLPKLNHLFQKRV